MDSIAKGIFSLWSSVRASEALLPLAGSLVNALLYKNPSKFPTALSKKLFLEYVAYLTNRVVASYSFHRLASKNISILSFIPSKWIKTSAVAHSFAEKIANAPGARFLPSAQKACLIPVIFTAVQVSLDTLYLSSREKSPSLRKLRNFCEQVASKLNALFFALMALYSFKNVGGRLKASVGLAFLVPSFVGGLCTKQGTTYSDDDIPRGVVCSVAISLILGKYVKELSWLPQSQAHLVIGVFSCWSAFQSATSTVGYYRPQARRLP